MSLLNPIALAWAAIALPIIGLYILRIRRRRQVVPTLMFWDRIFQDTAPRSLWRRMRHWLSLALQLAFMLLLVLALADPVWRGKSHKPVHYVLVLDTSASMKATDGAPTRFDEAKAAAARVIRSMRTEDQATLIGADRQPVILCGRTHHQPTLHRAVQAMTPTDTSADLKAALRLAGSVDVADQERVVVLISDPPGLAQVRELIDTQVTTVACGRDTPNLAITGFAVRPRSDNPLELQGILKLANFGPEKASAEVRLLLDDDLFDVVLQDLDPGQEKVHTFRLVHTQGRLLRARLSNDDALAVDNLAAAVLPAITERQVTLVSEGDLFLESVLRSHPWMKVRRVAPAEWAATVQTTDIFVFDSFVPDEMPYKPALYLYPSKDSRLWALGEELSNPLVSDINDDDSRLLRHVNLRNCTFHRARRVSTKVEGKAMVSSFEHPLLLRWAAASPPVVMLAVNTKAGESDLPWRTAFPILMQNTLNYLAGAADEPLSAARTGEPAVLAVGAGEAMARDEAGRAVPLSRQEDGIIVGPVDRVGVVEVQAGQKSFHVAFNLADSEESNLRAAPATQPATAAPALARMIPGGGSWPWWVVLLVVGTLLSTVEWCLHQRRVID